MEELIDVGMSPKLRREHARFLREELCIRMSQQAAKLRALPCGLSEHRELRGAARGYARAVSSLALGPCPAAGARGGGKEFTELLVRIYRQQASDMHAVALALRELRTEMGRGYRGVQAEVDGHLEEFLASRLGTRLLMKHHVRAEEAEARVLPRPGASGVFRLRCSLSEVLRASAADATRLCRGQLRQAPFVEVREQASPGVENWLPHVPGHLQYIFTEALKNSCRAVVEAHAFGFDDALPPVRCEVSYGQRAVMVRIRDEGGGIPKRSQESVWHLGNTSSPVSPWADGGEGTQSVLAGYGFGLALSRLYARHFGGDLSLESAEGAGTEVRLRLCRGGPHYERLLDAGPTPGFPGRF